MPSKHNLTPLLHMLCSLQVVMDEMDNIPALMRRALEEPAMRNKIRQDTKAYLDHTIRYIKQMQHPNSLLRQVWEVVPDDDFSSFIETKRSLIHRLQHSKFEDLNELHAMLTDAKRKESTLDVFETMLNTLAPNEDVRNIYRSQLGYTKEQYQLLKKSL